MRKGLSSALSAYRRYRAGTAASKAYQALRYLAAAAVVAYVSLLVFPQLLFAHEISHNDFRVYSREPLGPSIHTILDGVEARLSGSGIHDEAVEPRIFLADSHGLYALLSLYVGSDSFAKSYAVLPTSNVFVNKADVASDLVFRDSRTHRERSLSGVLTHEVTHLLIREKFGYVKNLRLATWKKEGYCEYVAGGSLLDHETGVRRWKEKPNDDSGYRYFKYYMLVKYLIEIKQLSVEEVFTRNFDVRALEAEVLSSL